jgi:hypothetical protein
VVSPRDANGLFSQDKQRPRAATHMNHRAMIVRVYFFVWKRSTMTQTVSRLSEQRAYLRSIKEHLEIPPLDDRPSFDDCTSSERQAVEVLEQSIRNNAGKTAIERMYERYSKKQLKRILGDPKVLVTFDDVGPGYKLLPDGVIPTIPSWQLPLRDAYIQYSKALSPEGYEEFHEACFWFLASTVAAHRIYAEFSDEIYTPLYFANEPCTNSQEIQSRTCTTDKEVA